MVVVVVVVENRSGVSGRIRMAVIVKFNQTMISFYARHRVSQAGIDRRHRTV